MQLLFKLLEPCFGIILQTRYATNAMFVQDHWSDYWCRQSPSAPKTLPRLHPSGHETLDKWTPSCPSFKKLHKRLLISADPRGKWAFQLSPNLALQPQLQSSKQDENVHIEGCLVVDHWDDHWQWRVEDFSKPLCTKHVYNALLKKYLPVYMDVDPNSLYWVER